MGVNLGLQGVDDKIEISKPFTPFSRFTVGSFDPVVHIGVDPGRVFIPLVVQVMFNPHNDHAFQDAFLKEAIQGFIDLVIAKSRAGWVENVFAVAQVDHGIGIFTAVVVGWEVNLDVFRTVPKLGHCDGKSLNLTVLKFRPCQRYGLLAVKVLRVGRSRCREQGQGN